MNEPGGSDFGRWTTADFEKMGWHDCHVHGLEFRPGEHGTGELLLDLDYILEWIRPEGEESFRFRIAPAILRFQEVFGLKINIDFASAAMGPFSIDGVQRRSVAGPRFEMQYWTIPINWPPGEMSFQASGFIQELTGSQHIKNQQHLDPGERA